MFYALDTLPANVTPGWPMPQRFKQRFYVPDTGEMRPDWWAWLTRFLTGHLRLYAGRHFELEIRPPKHSSSQRGYLFGVVYQDAAEGLRGAGEENLHMMLSDGEMIHMPVTPEMLHVYFKAKHGPRDEDGAVRSVGSYDTTELHDYIEAIRQDEILVSKGIWIPDPDPNWRAKRYA